MNKLTTTKEKIERAAISLIAARGVDAVSMRDIARMVEISEPAVYRHYPSKTELVWDIFTSNYDVFAAELDTLQTPVRLLKDKLRVMVVRCCEVFDTDQDLFVFLLLAQHIQRGAPKDFEAAFPKLLKTILAHSIAVGEIADQDTDTLSAMIMGCVMHTALYCLYVRPEPRKMVPLSDTLASACWRIAKGD